MKYSIASYSFHRALESGKQDMFGYITDCKEFGCSQLDPWNGHLVPLIQETEQIRAGADPLVTTFSPALLHSSVTVLVRPSVLVIVPWSVISQV